MIQATCTCGWTMAGPPADSWEIDEAVADHDVWCADAHEDWVQAEMDGQEIERGRIINAIRAKLPPHHADYVVGLITNKKSDHGNPAKSSPVIAQDQTTSKEIKPMYKTTTDSTASAWCPIWCDTIHSHDDVFDDGVRIHAGPDVGMPIHDQRRTPTWSLNLEEVDGAHDQTKVWLDGLDGIPLDLHELTALLGHLADAQRRLIEVGEV